MSLRLFPLPQDVCAYTPEELVRLWREHGVQRAVGLSRARSLRASAERSIGLTQDLHAARLSLRCWLQEYDLLRQQLEEIEQAIAELLKRIPGAMEMLSIPGVSEMTVAGFLAETGDLRQYRDWRQIRKLAGLNIVENR
ncbi:transposase, partial [Calditerricola satsumensis]